MSPNPPARTPEQRKQDVLERLESDVDLWLATADPASGTPYLVPLSYLWDGSTLLIATPGSNPTSRNIRANGMVRLGVGPTRDVVLIEGTARELAADEVPDEEGDAFAVHTGFDPRDLSSFVWFRIRPQLLQAWREANEIKGRDLMVDGEWVV
jgi:nitroimidazol reductase NimA-like FMN-containing flavoprotein (pyridoxamine 5'-phosphate oxidase superfamily)